MNIKKTWINFQISFSNFFVRNFLWVTLISIFVVIAVFTSFVLVPKYRLYTLQKNDELQGLKRMLASEEQTLKELLETEAELIKFRENPEIIKLLKLLPNSKEVANLFIQFEDLLAQEDFTIMEMRLSENLSREVDIEQLAHVESVETKEQKLKLHKIQVTLNVVGGGYSDLKNLLDTFEKSLRFVDINSLSFSPENDESRGNVNYNITATTYYVEE